MQACRLLRAAQASNATRRQPIAQAYSTERSGVKREVRAQSKPCLQLSLCPWLSGVMACSTTAQTAAMQVATTMWGEGASRSVACGIPLAAIVTTRLLPVFDVLVGNSIRAKDVLLTLDMLLPNNELVKHGLVMLLLGC